MQMDFDKALKGHSLDRLEEGIYFERLGVCHESEEKIDEEAFLFGTPRQDAECWHLQLEDNSGGIACQTYVIEQLTGEGISEQELCKKAEHWGFYDPQSGISTDDLVLMLEKQGFVVEYMEDISMRDAMEMLEDGKLLCAVSRIALEDSGMPQFPGISADCFVELTGIDLSDPANVRAYINAPYDKSGAGKACSWDAFSAAWKIGGRAAIYVNRRI